MWTYIILLYVLSVGYLTSGLNLKISGFNVQVFGSAKMEKDFVVETLAKVYISYFYILSLNVYFHF